MSVDVTVRFVTRVGCEPSNVCKEAYDAIQEIGAQSEWFPESQCESINTKQKNFLYIFEEFKGQLFEHIRSTGNRIYGPMCVITCMKNATALPKATHPVYSMAMKDVVASCTSIERAKRDDLHQQIQWMMGSVSKDFHEGVTHLIAGEVGSKKYIVGADLKKQIMSPDWVDALWKASKNRFISASDPQFLRQYRCPLFAGFVLTVSGIESEERAEIKRTVEAEGGRYSGEMKVNECTHLVLKQPKGQKYAFACKWKIHIVSPQWLTDSVEAGYCLREYKYKVGEGEGSGSTPDNHSTPTANGTKVDTSRLSSMSNISAISITHVDDTAFNLNLNATTSTTINHTVRASTFGDVSRVQQSMMATGGGGLGRDMTDVLDDVNMKELLRGANSVDAMEIFDGCKIFVSGFFGPKLEKVKKLINNGGGTRFDEITDVVTHIIMGNIVQAHIDAANALANRPHMLRPDWLVESTKAGKCLAEEAFYYSTDINTPEAPLTVKKKSKIQRLGSKADMSGTQSQDTTLRADKQEDNMADILSQYMMPANTTVKADKGESQVTMSNMTDDDSALLRAVEMSEAKHDETVDPAQTKADTPKVKEAVAVAVEDLPEDSIFQHKSFLIMGFEKPAEDELKELIEDRKGRVLAMNGRGIADYGVVPILSFPLTRTVNEVVTNAWLQMCVEQGKHLDPSSDLLFSPLDINPDLKPLEGCVPSVSGYTGTERDVLIHLAQLAGANVQEFFVRVAKPRQQLEASSHLVVNAPTGGKYNAAKKWNIPAVNKDWLIDSATLGKRQPEEYYYLENPTPKPTKTSAFNLSSVTTAADATMSPPGNTTGRGSNDKSTLSDETDADTTANKSVDTSSAVVVDKENDEVFKSPPLLDKPAAADKGKKVMKEPAIKAKNQRVQALMSETRGVSPKSNAALSVSSPSNVTPSKLFDPHNAFGAKFDFKDAYNYLESPQAMTPKGRHAKKKSLPIGEQFAQHLAIANKNLEKMEGTTFEQHIQQQQEEEEEEKPGPLRGVVIATAKKLIANQGDYNSLAETLGAEFRWKYDASVTHYIFVGRQNDTNKEFRKARTDEKTIVAPQWLYMCQEQNCRVEESLFPHTFNPNMSLSINTQKTPARPTRASARKSNLRSAQEDSPETITFAEPTPKAARLRVNRSAEAEEEETTVDETKQETKNESSANGERTPIEQMKSLMAATAFKKTRSRGGGRKNDSIESTAVDDSPSNNRTSLPRTPDEEGASKRVRLPRLKNKARLGNAGGADTQVEQSQKFEVGWDDPAARAQQEMLAIELSKHSESFSPRPPHHQPDDDSDGEQTRMETHQELTEPDPMEEEEQPIKKLSLSTKRSTPKQKEEKLSSPEPERVPSIAFPRAPSKHSPPKPVELIDDEDPDETKEVIAEEKVADRVPPVFLMSGLKPDERTDYGALIEKLGGEVSDAAHFDTKCTHLIVAGPTRNEKYLASVAAGKWVLHKSFLEASRSQAAFVDEEQYEWGCEATRAILTKLGSSAAKLAAAAIRWRKSMADRRKKDPSLSGGAFNGWRVVLLTDKKKEDGFKRLLEAGGATVLCTKPPFNNIDDCTHAFIEPAKLKYKVDVDIFVNAGIPCLKAEYIAAYLMDSPAPEQNDYYIPEVQAFMAAGESRKRRADHIGPDTPSKRPRH